MSDNKAELRTPDAMSFEKQREAQADINYKWLVISEAGPYYRAFSTEAIAREYAERLLREYRLTTHVFTTSRVDSLHPTLTWGKDL